MRIKKIIKERKEATLPSTRKEQLKDILKTDFALIIDICLFNLLFSLPLIAIAVLSYIALMSENMDIVALRGITFYMGLFSIIPFGIRGLAKGASYGLLKKRLFNEGCLIGNTFFTNLKKNFLHYFFSYLLLGIAFFITTNGTFYFLLLPTNAVVKGLGVGILILYFILRYAAIHYYLNLDNMYVLTFHEGIKNAYHFVFMTFIPSLLFVIMAFIIPVILIILNYWVMMIMVFVYLLFYDGFMMTIASLFSFSKFDKYINKDNYPEYVKKGLLKEE